MFFSPDLKLGIFIWILAIMDAILGIFLWPLRLLGQ